MESKVVYKVGDMVRTPYHNHSVVVLKSDETSIWIRYQKVITRVMNDLVEMVDPTK